MSLRAGAVLRKRYPVRVAGADGLFIQWEIDGDGVSLITMFELHAQALLGTATRMIDRTGRPDRPTAC
ncbi:hypothetical protein [Frankia sp. EAN1pec]|uniref:hypothetical protein n=1 Tax=Parafrankia sp. (strain EAN1pec) TaxID=298653 RepID=UPI0018DC35B9